MLNNVSVENNFIGGLKTEFTGLNFPENACTAASNCVFSIIGDVLRREGIDYELNATLIPVGSIADAPAYQTYKWNNAGGDGLSQIVVVQYGSELGFFLSSQAGAMGAALSSELILGGVVDISQYAPPNTTHGIIDIAQTECQFADGNGYLFVFHPFLDPFFVQFNPSGPAIQTTRIALQIRDFMGVSPEPGNPAVNFRPTTLTSEHSYNLQNQGWTNNQTWTASSTTPNLTFTATTVTLPLGTEVFTVASGISGITPGNPININWSVKITYAAVGGGGTYTYTDTGTAVGTVTSYSGTTLTTNITSSTSTGPGSGSSGILSISGQSFAITSSNILNTITTWHTAEGNYPSNADIWWEFKDTTGAFNPATVAPQVPLSSSQAPQGHFLINPFNQQRSSVSGIAGITDITTFTRPRTGCWFQGRVWYAGVDASQQASGDMPYFTWTENIYFSQIVSDTTTFGLCFQANDPTDDRLFNLLPDDGGVITIQGTGPVYKLFPIQNGLLVFAANGVWLIRGNSGLGFTADDFSVNKISAVKTISGVSFVDVLGLPFFWNAEGIYRVAPTQAGSPYQQTGFTVEPLTVGTILSFYNNIPFDSKRFARGTYDPISYVISWIYRSTEEANVVNTSPQNRYAFDSSLNLNVFNKAFYPYTFPNTNVMVGGIIYVDYPSGSLEPQFKYLLHTKTNLITFGEERDNVNWVDFHTFDGVGQAYNSTFTTGYKVHGQAFKKWSPIYLNVFSNNSVPTAYTLQSVWDYANNTKTGKISSRQQIFNPITSRTMASGISWPDTSDFDFVYRRHRLTGHGETLQLKFSSIDGQPMHIIGWSIPEQINQSA